MERRNGTASGPQQNRIALVLREHLDVLPDPFDQRRSDEHGVERVVEAAHVKVRFETVKLAAVAVAADREVDQPEATLIVAPVEYLAMPMAVLWGFWVFSEVPDLVAVSGIILIAGSGLFMVWREAASRSVEVPDTPRYRR